MVLSRRAASGDQVISTALIDGTEETNITKFFFYFENDFMRGKSDDEKVGELLAYLDGEAFSFYYETFSQDERLLHVAKDYRHVNDTLVDNFREEVHLDELIHQAVFTRLDYDNMERSLKDMDRALTKAGFNDEAKFGLLKKALMEHVELAQFAGLRGTSNYEELKKVIKDFVNNRKEFHTIRALQEQPLIQNSRTTPQPPHVTWQDQVPKKVLVRDPQRNELEHKVNALADQLSQLTLFVKRNQGTASTRLQENEKICACCRRSGHYANQCDDNPHRNTICPRCHKRGHSEPTCWAKTAPGPARKIANARSESDVEKKLAFIAQQEEEEKAETHVSVVAEVANPDNEDVIAAAKGNADGQPIAKQQKTGEEAPIDLAIEHRRYPILTPDALVPKKPNDGKRGSSRRRQAQKKTVKSKKYLQEQASKYHAVSELANVLSGLTFGQLIRGDADDACKELRRLLGRGTRSRRTLATSIGSSSRRLKVLTVSIYDTSAHALLDSVALPNLISAKLTSELGLQPRATPREITVADGSSTLCIGTLSNVPICFGELSVPMSFLVADGTPFDVIIGCPTLEMVQTRIDLGRQHVKMTSDGTTLVLSLEHDDARQLITDSHTDSEDFTSGSDDIPESSESSESSEEEDLVITVAFVNLPNLTFTHVKMTMETMMFPLCWK